MKYKGFLAFLFGLGLILVPAADSHGAPGKGRGNGGKKTLTVQQDMAVSPTAVRSPITADESTMRVCVSGFSEGNWVTVAVPWWGSPDQHTSISYGQIVDASGGFCVQPPPDWTTMTLEPGTYVIKSIWYKDTSAFSHNQGPETTFDVMP